MSSGTGFAGRWSPRTLRRSSTAPPIPSATTTVTSILRPDATVTDALAVRAEIEVANRNMAAASLDDIERRERSTYSLRWILVHMIEEYARHCGHADLLRQAIDGATGD